MRQLWLVYERANVARNQFFIDQWGQAAARRQVRIHTVLYEDLRFGIKNSRPFIEHAGGLPLPAAAVMRMNQPLLSAQYEAMGIPLFNNAKVARICNDKRLTHQLISQLAPAMDTVFLRGDEDAAPLPYPLVLKAAHSCGGRQVYLAHNEQEYRQALLDMQGAEALAQTMSDTPGRDVRAYVLGREIVAVMMRRSDSDFRSNIGQGGDAVPYTLLPEDEALVRRIIDQFDFGLVGIDFILHQGRLVFNEIEDAVGTRMLFAGGHEDIVHRYLDFILNNLDK